MHTESEFLQDINDPVASVLPLERPLTWMSHDAHGASKRSIRSTADAEMKVPSVENPELSKFFQSFEHRARRSSYDIGEKRSAQDEENGPQY